MSEYQHPESPAWHTRSFGELVRLAWPIAVSTVSFTIMTLVDTLIVGRLGTAELAGVGLAGTSIFFLLCFSFGLLGGAKVLVSQATGAGRRDAVLRYTAVAISAAGALGIGTLVLAELASGVVPRMAATPAAAGAARTYMTIRALGAPCVLVQVALREIMQGQGDARSPMLATVVANLANVGLALGFVFGLGLGVAGAAWAAVLAHGIEACVLLVVQRSRGGLGLVVRHSPRGFWSRAFDPDCVGALWRVGAPLGLQFMLEVGSFAALTLAVSTFSEVDMAAHQIALQVIHFSFMPCVAVGEAASVLAGQAVGANRDDLVLRVGRRAALLAGSYAGACAIGFFLASRLIAGAFTADAAVIGLVVRLLRLAVLFQLFDAINIIARSVLRGAGDVRYAAVVGVIVAWLCTPTLAWGLGHGLGMGAFGGWLGVALEILVSAALLATRVERLGWAPAASLARARLRASLPVITADAGDLSAEKRLLPDLG